MTDSRPGIFVPTHNRLVELRLNLSQEPLEGLGAETKLFGHSFGAEGGAQMDVEKQRGVLLGLLAQRIVTVHDHQLLTQLLHAYAGEKKKT